MNDLTRWRLGELSDGEYLTGLLEHLAEVTLAIKAKEIKEADARMARLGIAPRD